MSSSTSCCTANAVVVVVVAVVAAGQSIIPRRFPGVDCGKWGEGEGESYVGMDRPPPGVGEGQGMEPGRGQCQPLTKCGQRTQPYGDVGAVPPPSLPHGIPPRGQRRGDDRPGPPRGRVGTGAMPGWGGGCHAGRVEAIGASAGGGGELVGSISHKSNSKN
jgi:hypothetical protein